MKLPEKWQKVVEQNTEYIVHFSVKIKKNVFFFFFYLKKKKKELFGQPNTISLLIYFLDDWCKWVLKVPCYYIIVSLSIYICCVCA